MENKDEHSKAGNRTERIDWIDIAKGIAILCVPLGHNVAFLEPVIYSFHMPLFFILVGYTIRKVEKDELLSATLKDAKRLIIPFILIRALIELAKCVLQDVAIVEAVKSLAISLLWGNYHGTLFGMPMPFVGRIWFLSALFWTKLFYRIIVMFIGEKYRVFVLIPLSCVSMYMGMHGVTLPHNFDMLFVCMLFVEIGVILKKYDINQMRWWIKTGIFAAWIFVSCFMKIFISMNNRMYPYYVLCIVVATAGTVCVFLFSQHVSGWKISKPLIFYGINSLVLLGADSIAPCIYIAHTGIQKIVLVASEFLVVIVYVFIKNKMTGLMKS